MKQPAMNPSPLILAVCLLTPLTAFGQGTSNVVTVADSK